MSQQKPSYVTAVTWPSIFALLLVVAATLSAVYSYHLLQSANAPRKAQGNDFEPQLLLITNERNVAANVQVSYYAKGYKSSIGSLTVEGKHPGTFPIGISYLQISFSGGRPGTTLEYSLLFNQVAESNVSGVPVADSRNLPENPVSLGVAGSQVVGNCTLPEDTKFAQLFFGAVPVGSDGTAATQIAGLLKDQHPYLAAGDSDIVNVVEFLPTSAATNAGSITSCKWLFPDSPYLGGVQWYSPILTGSVQVGRLSAGYTVQGSNPVLENLSSLYWQFSGPTAINYILTDDSIERKASDELFLAGVLGALATGFGVEFLKTCFELRSEVSDVREKRKAKDEKEQDQRQREKERVENAREREIYRDALTRIANGKPASQQDFVVVLKFTGMRDVCRRIAYVFRKSR